MKRSVKDSKFTRTNPIAYNFSQIYDSGGYLQFPRFGWYWLDDTLYDWRYDFSKEPGDSMGFNRWDIDEPPQSPDPIYDKCAVSEAGVWRSADCKENQRVVCEMGERSNLLSIINNS